MAVPKTPLFSLGAHGSLGGTLTFQRQGRRTIARKKPIPTDRYTLLQAYQRFDYQDYSALWHSLSTAQKEQWATNARPLGISGFNYWIRDRLTTLPDIAARYHLDSKSGATVFDSSKNANHATAIGAYPTPGLIDNAFFFDNVDDRVTIPYDPTIQGFDVITLEAFAYPFAPAKCYLIFTQAGGVYDGYRLIITGGKLNFRFGSLDLAWYSITGATTLQPKRWYHCAATYDNSHLHIYLDGIEDQTPVAVAGKDIAASANPVIIGNHVTPVNPANGLIDHAVIYNRVLTATEILRHSKRRWP
ncbi:hypothetical protein ES703_119426 [subsurface metagenome]